MHRPAVRIVVVIMFASLLGLAPAEGGQAIPKELLKAAMKGNAAAQYAVGAALESQGNTDEATDWFGKAAARNYAGAEFKLGELAERRNNPSEALAWYRRAAAGGLAQASTRVEELEAAQTGGSSSQSPSQAVQGLPPATSDVQSVGPPSRPASAPDAFRGDGSAQGSVREESPATSTSVANTAEGPHSAAVQPSSGGLDLLPILGIAIAVLALMICVPYVVVESCHRRGIVLYATRRSLVAFALLTIPFVFTYGLLVLAAVHAATSGIESVDVMASDVANFDVVAWVTALDTEKATVAGVALLGLFTPALHWIAIGRLNPNSSVAQRFRGAAARCAAVGPTYVCLCFFWAAISGSRKRQNESALAHELRRQRALATAVGIGWLFWAWMNFVCYPDPRRYPALAQRNIDGEPDDETWYERSAPPSPRGPRGDTAQSSSGAAKRGARQRTASSRKQPRATSSRPSVAAERDTSDAYAVLGIRTNATREEVRAAYRALIVQYHPDRVAQLGPELRRVAEEMSKKINAAYERLIEQEASL